MQFCGAKCSLTNATFTYGATCDADTFTYGATLHVKELKLKKDGGSELRERDFDFLNRM